MVQSLLASMDAGCCDSTLVSDRRVLFEFIGFLGRPSWTALGQTWTADPAFPAPVVPHKSLGRMRVRRRGDLYVSVTSPLRRAR
ncbi:hypothetical protein K1W54_24515 [Micromonospora sp. CPCC 205371]|nr:hypothetical protein [Micromonospora sp. CPCC 205371]